MALQNPARGRALAALALATTAALALPAAADPEPRPGKEAPSGRPEAKPRVDIPFEKYRLENGLTVILHRDASLPIVAVNVLYKVGSRHEEKGRTGFAHLFEHLMFMGTKRAPTKMFDAWMEKEGGWNNAWTSEDRTDYFDVGPAHVLPLLLWLEADRMSSLAESMTKEKLDAQREVVRNERRQTSENEPYGKAELLLPTLLYPPGHPYHHPVIGSHEDLQAATVEDVKTFFRRWYAPQNASLVVAGDFDPAKVKPMIERFFGWIPAGKVPEAPVPASVPQLQGTIDKTIEDDVKLPKIIMAWHSPPHFAKGDAELDLLASILEEGKTSRLYKSLVYDKSLAQEVSAVQESGDLGSVFRVEAIARPGVPLEKLEAGIESELGRVRTTPVTLPELARAKNQFETAFVSRLQSVQARASVLNLYEGSKGDPGFAEQDLARYRNVDASAILRTAKDVIQPHARVILRVVPRGTAKPDVKGGAKGGGS